MVVYGNIFTARKRSLGQGNIFAPVCHSVHRGVHGPPWQVHTPPGRYTPLAGTPPGRYTPLAGTTPRQVHPSGKYTPWQVHPWAGTPLGRYTPWQVHPPGRHTPQAGTPSRYTLLAGTPLRQVHPQGAVQAGRYGQQVDGTHPTGMHSCLVMILKKILTEFQKKPRKSNRQPFADQEGSALSAGHITY